MATTGILLNQNNNNNDNLKIAIGIYEGDGNETQKISLNFKPRCVIVTNSTCAWYYNNNHDNYNSGMSVEGFECNQIGLDENGFIAKTYDTPDASGWGRISYDLNSSGQKYRYIAFS